MCKRKDRTILTLLQQPIGSAVDPDINADRVVEILNDHVAGFLQQAHEVDEYHREQLRAALAERDFWKTGYERDVYQAKVALHHWHDLVAGHGDWCRDDPDSQCSLYGRGDK